MGGKAVTHAMADPQSTGDIGELYALHARRLERIVRVDVHAPRPVIEDACQFAWGRLITHADRVRRETALPWLVATAVHHAFRLSRREERDVSLECMLERAAEPLDQLLEPSADQVFEQRQTLADIRLLPARQQRLVWLQVLGLSYEEMAAREACTVRTVQRQLLRGKRAMRERAAA
jgi:RNA polymerase sigma factor (sigma-70 family)